MKTYTKEEILKAAEIGEVSMIDAKHIVSLLDEARTMIENKSNIKIREKLFDICNTDMAYINYKSPFTDIAIDSIDIINLIILIEGKFNISIPDFEAEVIYKNNFITVLDFIMYAEKLVIKYSNVGADLQSVPLKK